LNRAGWKSQTTIKKPDHDAKSAAALSAFLPNTSSPGSKNARALPPGPGVEMLASARFHERNPRLKFGQQKALENIMFSRA
jgi:hypothetical protein